MQSLCIYANVNACMQVAKGGEADDALKRVMLEFHTTQLIARKQALIVLLSGKCLTSPFYCQQHDHSLILIYVGASRA